MLTAGFTPKATKEKPWSGGTIQSHKIAKMWSYDKFILSNMQLREKVPYK